jgi:hypothetical protein
MNKYNQYFSDKGSNGEDYIFDGDLVYSGLGKANVNDLENYNSNEYYNVVKNNLQKY